MNKHSERHRRRAAVLSAEAAAELAKANFAAALERLEFNDKPIEYLISDAEDSAVKAYGRLANLDLTKDEKTVLNMHIQQVHFTYTHLNSLK